MSDQLKTIYLESCLEELKVNKPGNHSLNSKIMGMYSEKFLLVSKISAKFLVKKNLSLGEMIFYSTKKCIDSINSNYNLGIILLCAPLMKAFLNKPVNLRKELRKVIKNTGVLESNLIIDAIKYANPSGLKKYKGVSNVLEKKQEERKILEIMLISSPWDRISKCYVDNYSEIFDFGLPFFYSLKKKLSREKAIQMLYLEYASKSLDSHLLRKFGSYKANAVMKMFRMLSLKILRNPYKDFSYQIGLLDAYLKNSNCNPGTCADLTVTTLLIDKIKDIFKIQL